MKERIRSIGIALIFGTVASVLVAGCTSTKNSEVAEEQTMAYTEGMMCPKCETVWVTYRNRLEPHGITPLSYEHEMTCPDCDKMARSQLLDDGEVMLHECPTCKVTPTKIQSSERPKHYIPRKGFQR